MLESGIQLINKQQKEKDKQCEEPEKHTVQRAEHREE